MLKYDFESIYNSLRLILKRICCIQCSLVQNIEVTLESDTLDTCVGDIINLTATVTGGLGSIRYLWELSHDGVVYETLGTTNTNMYAVETIDHLNHEGVHFIKVTASDTCSSISSEVEVMINEDPEVFISSENTEICVNNIFIISSEVTGGSGSNSYQWQELIDNEWVNAEGTSTQDQYGRFEDSVGQYQFRLVVNQDPFCEGTSSPITITVSDC